MPGGNYCTRLANLKGAYGIKSRKHAWPKESQEHGEASDYHTEKQL